MILYKCPQDFDFDNWTQIAGFDNPKKQVWVSRDEPELVIGRDVQIKKLPQKLQKLIAKWEGQIEQLKSINFDMGYVLYDATTSFIYNDKYYRLKPFAVNAPPELFEFMKTIIEHDLHEAKCPYICSISLDYEDKYLITKALYSDKNKLLT